MRIMSIVTGELAIDRLKAEENLQDIINSKENVNIRVGNIKKELERIVLIDNMMTAWQKYTPTSESNNNNEEK